MVSGGLRMNWWAREGWETSCCSVVESGVEISERRFSCSCSWMVAVVVEGRGFEPDAEGSEVSEDEILRSGVAWMSPGATVLVLLACVLLLDILGHTD